MMQFLFPGELYSCKSVSLPPFSLSISQFQVSAAFAVDERCVDAAVLIFIPEYERDFIIAPFALRQ